jgi:HK97 family phage major capsid protein
MEHNNTLNKIDDALQNLENSFNHFQQKQEHRLKQIYSAQQRPFTANEEAKAKSDPLTKSFFEYISNGVESYDQKSLTSQEGLRGGYFVPEPTREHIQQNLIQASPLRNLARVTNISGDSLELLLDKGCADVGWVNEVEERVETNTPELTKLRITTHQIYAKPRASQKLLDDSSIDLENWLVSKVVDKIARAETLAFIHGDGDNKPRGFLNYLSKDPRSLEVFKTGLDGELQNSDVLLETLNSMKPEYLTGAVWMMSRSAMATIRRLKDKSTGNYLWQPGLIAGQPHTLLGHQVVLVDEMPTLIRGQASLSIAFANFYEGYQIVDRGSLHILRDP